MRTIRWTFGKLGLEAAEDEREHVGRDRGRGADEQLPHPALAQLAQELAAARERLQRALRVGTKRAPFGRQAHAAGGADEELDPELPLELLDPRRQGRLRHVENGSRRGHRPALGDGEKRLDLGEEHLLILTWFIG